MGVFSKSDAYASLLRFSHLSRVFRECRFDHLFWEKWGIVRFMVFFCARLGTMKRAHQGCD